MISLEGPQICTAFHRFAQGHSENSIDDVNEKHYVSSEIEQGSVKTFQLSLRGRKSLTADAPFFYGLANTTTRGFVCHENLPFGGENLSA
jgi:hypothetical protein